MKRFLHRAHQQLFFLGLLGLSLVISQAVSVWDYMTRTKRPDQGYL
jgi:hypothetical protein